MRRNRRHLAYAILSLQGPRSREILQALSGADLSTKAVPFRQSCMPEIGPLPLRSVRVTHMGKLTYELNIFTEYSHATHDAQIGAIRAAGVLPVHCGVLTLD